MADISRRNLFRRTQVDKPKSKTRPVYREQYGLITLCADAREQQRLYERLTRMGLRVRVVTT